MVQLGYSNSFNIDDEDVDYEAGVAQLVEAKTQDPKVLGSILTTDMRLRLPQCSKLEHQRPGVCDWRQIHF